MSRQNQRKVNLLQELVTDVDLLQREMESGTVQVDEVYAVFPETTTRQEKGERQQAGGDKSRGNTADAASPRERTLLYEAALLGETDAVRCLCSAGADVNIALPQCGSTALHAAAEAGEAAVVELLLQSNADAGKQDTRGEIPLLRTLVLDGSPGRACAIKLLYSEAARACRTKQLLVFMHRYSAYHPQASKMPDTHTLTEVRHVEILPASAKELLQASEGPTMDPRGPPTARGRGGDDQHGGTPLHSAALRGHSEAVAMLLELGADPTIRNKFGKNCLEVAKHPHESVTVENRDKCVALIEKAVAKRSVRPESSDQLLDWLRSHPEIKTPEEAAQLLKQEMMDSNGEPHDWMVRVTVAGGDRGLDKVLTACCKQLGRDTEAANGHSLKKKRLR